MTEDDAVTETVAAVRARIDPDAEERKRLEAAVEELIERTESALSEVPVSADVLQVGSTARGTWLSGDRDIDLFVRFPPDLDRESLETYGLQVGRAVLPNGYEEYAEHPYIKGEYRGFSVDLVPCYRVERADAIQSAVDRTPFHNAYLEEHLTDELTAEVRLFKQFLTGIGAYGSDLRTHGFSGYLAELLVVEYGSFRAVLEAVATEWRPPVRFDPEGHGRRSFDDPLVMIDPTDPDRNVAAVVSATNVSRLQHYARRFLEAPNESFFSPDEPTPLSPDEVREQIDRRGTVPVALRFPIPDLVEDQLYPQLRRSRIGVAAGLNRRGFEVLRSAAFARESAVLFFELAVATLPTVERHEGPPVFVREHADGFHEKYADTDAYGPFIDGERYVVEREREFTSAVAFLESEALFDVGLGASIQTALREEYELLIGPDVGTLAVEFGAELGDYFSPSP